MRRPLDFFFSRVFLCIGTAVLLGVSSSQAQGYPHQQGLLGAEVLPGQLIVKYKDNTFSPTPLSALGAVSTQQLVPTSK